MLTKWEFQEAYPSIEHITCGESISYQRVPHPNSTPMIKQMTLLLTLFFTILQPNLAQEENSPSPDLPFGRVHPEAPTELQDFAPLIGICDCQSLQRNAQGEWGDTVQTKWQFKYIMNGKAIQDETWKADGGHSTSIRQYNADSSAWYVTFFGSNFANPSPPVWAGGKQNGDIVLNKPQKAPNGMDGMSRLTFSEISDEGFNWIGEWVNEKQGIIYPFWKITCRKRRP